MHENVLPAGSARYLNTLEALDDPALSGWTLAGGTGLALRIGHRISEDFDFFRTDAFDLGALRDPLARAGSHEVLQSGPGTLTLLARGRVKVSFFRVRDPFLHPATPFRFFAVADARDIALMKLAAIAGRGSRKDFVDLYFLLRGGLRLADLLEAMPRKYGADRVNDYHLLRSLTWFEDAEREPMPRMIAPVQWKECRAYFIREARSLTL